MDEITLDEKTYVSSKRAAQITGYAKDYVGQLCREGRVEARLVGRNWYVLEKSIREHRFGVEPGIASETSAEDPNGAWESPSYAPEPVSTLPVVDSAPRMAPESVHEPLTTPVIDHESTVQEMQNAWQDWFSRRNIAPSEEIGENLLETPEVIDARNDTPEENMPDEDHTQEVHIVKMGSEPIVEEEIEDEEVQSVPIHREFTAKVENPYLIPSTPVLQRNFAVKEMPPYVPQRAPEMPVYVPPQPCMPKEGRVLRERRVQRRRKPSVALQALFLSVAAISIAIAFIGSGQIDSFLSQNGLQYGPINFFGGENIVNNTQ